MERKERKGKERDGEKVDGEFMRVAALSHDMNFYEEKKVQYNTLSFFLHKTRNT